jgi:dTDP-glucose pyrophosphorylase
MDKQIDFTNPVFISIDCNALTALEQMDVAKRKLLIVVDGIKFIGVLSIGDIQRAIINKYNLNKSIRPILRDIITVCLNTESPDTIRNKMFEIRAECMPILDEKNNLVDVLFWEDIFGNNVGRKIVSLNLPVVIMAGGRGSRLKPLTNIIPKPLLPINEKTIIEDIMEGFLEIGCSEFYLSVNYKSDMIRHYFDNLNNPNYNITYFEEGKPLGTAGSMYLIKEKIHSTFFVSNCDILIDQDLEEIYKYHIDNKNDITIVSAIKRYKIPYGTIETGENGILNQLDEKPELVFQINTGMYILEPGVLKFIPENEFFHLTHLIESVKAKDGKIGVFPISENSWQDIGSWNDYSKILQIH